MRGHERVFGFCLPAATSSFVAARVPSFGSYFELSKVANANCFDDVSRFGVFSRISRFGPLKAQ